MVMSGGRVQFTSDTCGRSPLKKPPVYIPIYRELLKDHKNSVFQDL